MYIYIYLYVYTYIYIYELGRATKQLVLKCPEHGVKYMRLSRQWPNKHNSHSLRCDAVKKGSTRKGIFGAALSDVLVLLNGLCLAMRM